MFVNAVKKAVDWFRLPQPEARKRRSVDLSKITPDHVPEGALAALWDLHDGRMPLTPQRIRDARDLLAGKKRAPMPEEFSLEDREAFRADGPDKYERARETARRLAAKKARIDRPVIGLGEATKKVSTKIETFANGLLDELFPDLPAVDILLNEGEAMLEMLPMPAYWERVETLYDEDGDEEPLLGQSEYDALPENRRPEYESFDQDVPEDEGADDEGMAYVEPGEDGAMAKREPKPTGLKRTMFKRVRAAYRLDANLEHQPDENEPGHEEWAFDRDASLDFYQDQLEDFYARNIPIHLEILSRLDFIPLNPRFSGKKVKVDGAICRRLFRRSELLDKGYRWTGCEDLLEPVDALQGNDGDFYLYTLYYLYRGRPLVIYQVGDRGTTFQDGTTAVIDLWQEYGIPELPIHFEYGQFWAASDPDLRSMPFTQPYMQNWLNRDAVLTGLNIAAWASGFPTWGQKIDKNSLPQAINGEVDLAFQMRPNSIVPLYGDLIQLTSTGSNQDVRTILMALDTQVKEDLPDKGAFGGDGPTSGLDRQVQGRDVEIAHGDVIEAYRRTKEAAGRFGLMIADALGKKSKRPVSLYVSSPGPIAQVGQQSTVTALVQLKPGLIGKSYDVVAVFPNRPGENLAGIAQLQTLAEAGLILREEFRELWGDPHPEIFEAKLRIQRYYDSPEGQMDLMQGMAEYLADEKLRQLYQLAGDNRVTGTQPGAFSTAAMGDLHAAGGGAAAAIPGGQGAPQMSIQDPGQAAVAGAAGGAMNASAASAGAPTNGMAA